MGKKKGGRNKRNNNNKTSPPNTQSSTNDTATATTSAEPAILQIPSGVTNLYSILTPSQKKLIETLCATPYNQQHLFQHWSDDNNIDKEQKLELVNQLETLDSSYKDGGICGYIKNACKLLGESSKGVNPYEGYSVEVPDGANDDFGGEEYSALEGIGLGELKHVGFVLVAGGLGERLGYKGIKIELPMDITSGQTYLEYYIGMIQSYQQKYGEAGTKLPLCIMTSKDTHEKTVSLLEKKDWFGMKEEITIVQQGMGVPAIEDGDGTIALDPNNLYKIWTKPHGHGDIHALLHSHEVAKTWLGKGMKYIVLFQDTNGLAFHTLPYVLGVSKKRGFVMNSVAVPRKAGQAIGGICRLVKEDEQRTINVEYNQLKHLLQSGDINDESTGFSPFPGNINQLVFELSSYVETLERSKGMVPEFVNPKYQPNSNTFKSPTRLECMMQDFPLLYDKNHSSKVGFTQVPTSLSFSPVKNTIPEGVKLQQQDVAPAVAASAEADQHTATRKILRTLGCGVEDQNEVEFQGIQVIPGPKIVFYPSFVSSFLEYKQTFVNPTKVVISGNSTLIVKGGNIKIESLVLDGTLIVEIETGADNAIIQDLVVNNKGWRYVPASDSDDDVIRMRGYNVDKVETKIIQIFKDGSREEKTIGYTDIKIEPVQEDDNVAAHIAAEDKLAMEMLDEASNLPPLEKVETLKNNIPKDALKDETKQEERIASKRAEIEAKVQRELVNREKINETQRQIEEERLAAKRAEIEQKVQDKIAKRKEDEAAKKAHEGKLVEEKKALEIKEAADAAKKIEEDRLAVEKREEHDRLAAEKKREEERLVAEALQKAKEENLERLEQKVEADRLEALKQVEEKRLEAEKKKQDEDRLAAAEAFQIAKEEKLAAKRKAEADRLVVEALQQAEEKRLKAEIKASEEKLAIEAARKTEKEKEEKELVNLADQNAQDNTTDKEKAVDEKSTITSTETPQQTKSIVDDPCDIAGCGCIIN